MNAYKLWWVITKAILTGHGRALVWFDTEARTYDYHMALVGSAYCEDPQLGEGHEIHLHEER